VREGEKEKGRKREKKNRESKDRKGEREREGDTTRKRERGCDRSGGERVLLFGTHGELFLPTRPVGWGSGSTGHWDSPICIRTVTRATTGTPGITRQQRERGIMSTNDSNPLLFQGTLKRTTDAAWSMFT
jgi:hypothetical protein